MTLVDQRELLMKVRGIYIVDVEIGEGNVTEAAAQVRW